MSYPSRGPGRRVAVLAGGWVLLAGLAVLLPAAAEAQPGAAAAVSPPCGTAVAAAATCTSTGTISLSAGSLTLISPSALGWTGTVSGLDQNLVDATAAHQAFTVGDATGSAAGWHITVSATQFTTGTKTLANTGTFSLTGSVTSLTATTAPTAACGGGSTCTLPTDTTTYPVAITTAASAPTAATVYATGAATGVGVTGIGAPGANPVGWWVSIPGNTPTGTYTSTITLGIISAP